MNKILKLNKNAAYVITLVSVTLVLSSLIMAIKILFQYVTGVDINLTNDDLILFVDLTGFIFVFLVIGFGLKSLLDINNKLKD